jgi:hypothetical protein
MVKDGIFGAAAAVALRLRAALLAALFSCVFLVTGQANALDHGWAVQGDNLYKVRDLPSGGGTEKILLTPEWSGATSMAARSSWLHIITGGALWRASPTNGSWTLLNGEDWSGPTQMAWNASTGKLYIIQADRLWQMTDADNSGAYTLVNDSSYSNHTSMTSIAESLYVIRNNNLYKVNPTTGSRSVLGTSGIWTGATRMTTQHFGGGIANARLYVVQGSTLWQVNPSNGSRTQFGSNTWSSTTAVICSYTGIFTSTLHIFNSNRLYRVNNIGERTDTSGSVWSGVTAAAGNLCNI